MTISKKYKYALTTVAAIALVAGVSTVTKMPKLSAASAGSSYQPQQLSTQVSNIVDHMENAIDYYDDVRVTASVDQLILEKGQTSPTMEHSSYQLAMSEKNGQFGGTQTTTLPNGQVKKEFSDGTQLLRYYQGDKTYQLLHFANVVTQKERPSQSREKDIPGHGHVIQLRQNPTGMDGDAVKMMFPQVDAYLIRHATNVTVLGTDTLNGMPVTEIQVTGFTKAKVNFDKMLIWVNQDTGIELKRELYNSKGENTYNATLSTITFNKGVNPSEYKITPPSGATLEKLG